MLLLREHVGEDLIEAMVPVVRRLVSELKAGGASETEALGAVFQVLWNYLRECVATCAETYKLGPSTIKAVLVCYECGVYRQGRRWLKGDPPEGYRTLGCECPKCCAKFSTRFRDPDDDDDDPADELHDALLLDKLQRPRRTTR